MNRLLVWMFLGLVAGAGARGDEGEWGELAKEYEAKIQPLVVRYCHGCHSGDLVEANVDFGLYPTLAAIQKDPGPWRHVGEVLRSGEMPPVEETQPSAEERRELLDWVRRYLAVAAKEYAGDPGPSVLRRLTNAEYTYVVRDLTGVATLDPAREFPVDGAAGEGFTNAAVGLAMSPALVGKYLDAGKDVASHAVLLPGGLAFSSATTRRDWSEEYLAEIRSLYARYSSAHQGSSVNLQGIVFDTNAGGRLPVEAYFGALLEERAKLAGGETSIEQLARERKLSPKYLGSLKELLEKSTEGERPSLLLDPLRVAWKKAGPGDAAALAEMVSRHQASLWRFTSVGHIGKAGGPKAWMEPIDPMVERFEARKRLAGESGQDVVLYLVTRDAGDGTTGDVAVWERPRLVAPGRPDVLIKDLRRLVRVMELRKREVLGSTAGCLEAAAEVERGATLTVAELSAKHQVPESALVGWLDYLGLGKGTEAKIDAPLARTTVNVSGYDFVKGWVGDDALSVVANSSDQAVRIPGNMAGHGVAVHPAPTRQVAIGWRSPVTANLVITGMAQHAHPECGNGVSWSLELRRGHARQRLADGVAHGPARHEIGPVEKVAVQPGDLVSLVISPREQNHSCDLTGVDLTLKSETAEWNLAREVSADILAGNPHADGLGNAGVWHFYSEPVGGASEHVVPAGSLLARWQRTLDAGERTTLARGVAELLTQGTKDLKEDHPDKLLYRQLMSLDGPLLGSALTGLGESDKEEGANGYGLDPGLFGKSPEGGEIEGASLCVRAPSVLELRLPAELVAGSEFVTTGTLAAGSDEEGSVQFEVTTEKPTEAVGLRPSEARETTRNVPWTSNAKVLTHETPIVVKGGSKGEKRIRESLAEFREWFPAALCYSKIVPVDEVVTLTLFYREDEPLGRLMLSAAEKDRLEELWRNLHFVSRDALTLVDAYEQLMQYATQDADPKVFEPLREPILARAKAFREEELAAEPKHVASVKEFAARAYRRGLTAEEGKGLEELYQTLRARELDHESAIRLMLARVLVAPAFLYRVEEGSGEKLGTKAFKAFEVHKVTGEELAARLSFFLWSSVPDDRLRALGVSGELRDEKVLLGEVGRMLADPKARRLATEFACQWIHVYGFDEHNEKSAETYPSFDGLRGAMYEETIRFFMDLFARDGSILEVLDGDSTFVNDGLAKHYGMSDVTGGEWRRVEGLRGLGRGGILGMSSTLAKQSGASRTSPILRGNWVSEVLLGDKLPKPPKGVPPLPETVPAGLTERQLIERHSTEPSCVKCHARIDPLGFALEGFDGIGRARGSEGEKKYDTKTTLADGTSVEGLAGLREYLLGKRRGDFVKQFCRKLLGYALGRETELGDQELLDEMERRLTGSDYRFRSAIEAIVASPQFQGMRISREKLGISEAIGEDERLRKVAEVP